MKEVKTCQECRMEFRSKGGFSRQQKSQLLSLSDMEITSQLSPSKIEEMVKKATNKIVDYKLHNKDVLQELRSKIINLQLVESDNENLMKLNVKYYKIQ